MLVVIRIHDNTKYNTIKEMNIYFDSDLNCTIYLKNGKKEKSVIKWSFLMTKFIDELYKKYDSQWNYFKAFYSDTGNPYGKMYNSQETFHLRLKELKKVNFDSIVTDNFHIVCELFLKSEPNNPRYYTITKEELLNNFIEEMNNLHGKDWIFFHTFFEDTGEVAYGTIKNDSNLRKKNKLTWNGLKLRRYRINREKWENKLSKRVEIFYVLKFENIDFIKIGHTFRNIEYRLLEFKL